nr:calcium-translocating P-type ATPase, PMCA-type [Prevotella sp.]
MNDKSINNFRSTGLNEQEVTDNRQKFGQNVLTPPRNKSLIKLYGEKFRDPIIIILLIAAVVSLFLSFLNNDFIETIGIFLAIFLATTIGFIFELDAAKKFKVLTALGEEQSVKVRRSGKIIEIPRHDIVVGDVVLIEFGDEVPADGILFNSNELHIDESSLTGEPISNKSADVDEAKKDQSTYPCNMVLRSSMVLSGRGEYVVSAVGDATEIGKVARKSTETVKTKTPLNMQLDKLASLISKVGSAIAITAFVFFLVHDIIVNTTFWTGGDYTEMVQRVLNYFMMAVTLIVMAVPEGLPMAVTLALALNMRRMLKSNNLVRKLHACETMGAVNIICTDKTGTLTLNKMTVGDVQLYYGDEKMFAEAIAVNSTAELDEDKGIGNPTEVSLLLWMKKKGFDYSTLRTGIISQEPFSTEKKYMKTIASVNDEQHSFVKGAPEMVIKMCKISDADKKDVEEKLSLYQNKAMRTLAFAVDDTLQAVAAISDPVREDVPAAVLQCRKAGIEVKIVTGDTAATASEIGRQIHLFDDVKNGNSTLTDMDESVITGPEWAALTDEEASKRASKIRVMSRARPTDKQRLVELLQKQGAVVAVTGDGTNDAPALHYAHVGLSLGSGTSVAKEASDMTLLDDSFGSIANAVMWGRSLYKNIQRFLYFQLVVNITALLLVLAGSLIGTEMPLTVTQILWVNLIMDTFAAMALASLPPSREVMKDKPRKPSDFIITKSMGKNILCSGLTFFVTMFLFLIYCERRGEGSIVDVHELTLFFTTFVMMQFWNLFNAKCQGSDMSAFHRFFADKGLLIVLLIIFVGQWIIVTFGGKMFRTVPLSFNEWISIIAVTSMVLWIGELFRCFSRLHKKNI